MPTIAIVGLDGAGKTTIGHLLQESAVLPFKYVYMGINVASSNVALPTSRLLLRWRHRQKATSGTPQPRNPSLHDPHNRHPKPAGKLWAAVRLMNRLAEEWYRQLLVWSYQLRGYVVLFDRHFVFDCALTGDHRKQKLSERLHRWFLTHCYPRPNLVLYLDAPADVLFARKGESTLHDLKSRRQAFIRHGRQMSNFVQIDATQPLDQVYAEVTVHILRFCRAGTVTPYTAPPFGSAHRLE